MLLALLALVERVAGGRELGPVDAAVGGDVDAADLSEVLALGGGDQDVAVLDQLGADLVGCGEADGDWVELLGGSRLNNIAEVLLHFQQSSYTLLK